MKLARSALLIFLALGVLSSRHSAAAQQTGKMWRVEVLANTPLDFSFDGFREGLRILVTWRGEPRHQC